MKKKNCVYFLKRTGANVYACASVCVFVNGAFVCVYESQDDNVFEADSVQEVSGSSIWYRKMDRQVSR